MPNKDDYSIDYIETGSQGVIFSAKSPAKPKIQYPALREYERFFDYKRYAGEIHTAHALEDINTTLFTQELPRCLDMPLRLAGQSHYHLPQEWTALRPMLEEIIETEHAHNPHWRDYHTYLTFDCSRVEANEQQRHGGLHVDGFQGERIDPKTKITRNYVVSNNGGTRFFPQRFVVADPAQFNVFQGFDMQTQGWDTQNYQIGEEDVVYFMNAYTVHESGLARYTGNRFFVRLTWDLKRFDRKGNTHNTMLDYNWTMHERSIQKSLQSPDISDLESSPHYPPSKRKAILSEPMLLIGISGKPGSGKNWIAFRLLQELRHRGVEAHKTSLAKGVYKQANQMITSCQSGCSQFDFQKRYVLGDSDKSRHLFELWQGDVGEFHPVYGYHRRSQNVRQGLALLSEIRRGENPEYWFEAMLKEIRERKIRAAVFSDLRFSNEAEGIRAKGGFCLRAEVDPIWAKATQGRNPGYKYSEASLNSSLESALDSYPDFFAFVSAQTFQAEKITDNILCLSTTPV
jgi:hypothetical protein